MQSHRQALLAVIATVCLLSVGAGSASALLIEPVGDPMEGNSWGQRWKFSLGAGQWLSQVDIHWRTPSWEGLEEPAIKNISLGGWSGHFGSGALAWLNGPAITECDIEFDLWYTPECVEDPIEHDIVAWHGCSLVDAWTAKWDIDDWQIDNYGCEPPYEQPTGVPEPASCALLALAIGGLGATLRRRRSK